MNKSYNRINWENYPSEKTPLNKENLNKIDSSLDDIDDKIISIDTTKATKTEVATMIADVSFDETTGIFTFTRKNGSAFSIDTLLEKVIVNFDFDEEEQKLIIITEDGTKKEIDLSEFVSVYNFSDSDTLAFKRILDGIYTAYLNDVLLYLDYGLNAELDDGSIYGIVFDEIPSGYDNYDVEISGYTVRTNMGTPVPCSEFSEKKVYRLKYDMYGKSFIFINSYDIDKITGITAEIKKGSITGDYLEPNYLANVRVLEEKARTSSNSASNYANQAKSYAIGSTNSAKYYYEETKEISDSVANDYLPKVGAILGSSLNTNGYDIILSATKALDANSSNFTVPASGAIPQTVFNGSLSQSSNFKSFLGSVQTSDAVWYNMINVRHRNGGGDGSRYGMYIVAPLISVGNLTWRQQMGGNWSAEKTILDSGNWSDYVTPTFSSGTWYQIGDDAKIGDIDVAGTLGIIGNNGTTTLRLCEYGKSDKSGGNISYTSSGFTFNNSINSDAQGIFTTIGNGTNPTFAGLSLQLREYGKQGANVQTNGAGPGIGFHWYNRFAKMLVLGTDGLLHFYNQDCSDATIVAANCPNTTVGSATQPIYLGSNGVPTACTYTLGKSVPSNAVFTDTHNTAYLYAGKSTGSSNAATENGNTYLILSDGGTVRSRRKISGSGTVTVSSDSSGNITINGSGGSGGSSALDVEQVSSFLVYTNYGDKFTLKGNGNDLAYITQEDGCIGPLALGTNGDVILFSRTSALDFYEDAFEPWLYEGVAGSGKIDLGSSSAKWKNIYAATGTIQTSDRDQKNTIEDVDFDKAKKFIMGLKPSTFKFNDGESDRTHWGLIAQDIEELLDVLGWTTKDFAGFVKSSKTERVEILYEDDDEKQHIRIEDRAIEGEYSYSLRYDEFIAPMIRMEQSHENDIIELKKIVEKQQNELDYLRRVVAKIYDVFGMDFPEC